jgi:aminoglycoside phosphotransferase (APT) family kinase protein
MEARELDFGVVAPRSSSDAHGWPQLLGTQVEKWTTRISPPTLRSLGGSRSIAELIRRLREAPTDLNTLVHCDYLFRNLIIQSSATAVVIDFGTALVGDPRYDLAKIVWRDLDGARGKLSECFQRRWRELTAIAVPRELLSTYVACHSVAAIAWVEKQAAPDSSNRDFRDLAVATYASEMARWR